MKTYENYVMKRAMPFLKYYYFLYNISIYISHKSIGRISDGPQRKAIDFSLQSINTRIT